MGSPRVIHIKMKRDGRFAYSLMINDAHRVLSGSDWTTSPVGLVEDSEVLCTLNAFRSAHRDLVRRGGTVETDEYMAICHDHIDEPGDVGMTIEDLCILAAARMARMERA